jgi:putative FmdB family regulatory protein
MPVYEFRCECGHEFPLLAERDQIPNVAECPECDRTTSERVYSVSFLRGGRASNVLPEHPKTSIPNATLTDCVIENCGTGIKIGEGNHIKSRGLRFKNNRISIDNAGLFDGPDTKFE